MKDNPNLQIISKCFKYSDGRNSDTPSRGRGLRHSNAGFTFTELMVIIAVLFILVVIGVPTLRYFQKQSDLSDVAEGIINILRLAQAKTLASEAASKYGVHFESNKFVLFKGATYSSTSSGNEVHNLSSRVEIYQINLTGSSSEVIFERVSGIADQSGDVSLRLKDDLTEIKTITIQSSGQITLGQEATPTDTDRIKDSRHTHFNYNADAQNALTLHLIFPDYTGDNYDINFQDYLDVDKTKFSWEGTVLVGPTGNKTSQELEIYTHNLSAFSAQFCVHRDRRSNDKALQITLDDQNLINYTSGGATTKGSSVYVSDPEPQ